MLKKCESLQYENAQKYFQDNKIYVDAGWYEDTLIDTKKRQFEEKANAVKSRLHELFKLYCFEEAKEYYRLNMEYVNSDWCRKTENCYIDRQRIENLLQEHRFLEADNWLAEKDANCFVLGRRNQFGCFKKPENLKEKILGVFSEEEKDSIGKTRIEEKIHVMTAHKSKGKEADIVFILKCNLRSFPMMHPDNRLFEIFGETEEKVLADEKRLFYVALTRSRRMEWGQSRILGSKVFA